MKTIQDAMEYAYRAAGVKEFTVTDGVYTSLVQHHSGTTKRLRDSANSYLKRHGVDYAVQVTRNDSGLAQYKIH